MGGVEAFGARVVQVAAGSVHTAAVTDDGRLWAWGGVSVRCRTGLLLHSSVVDVNDGDLAQVRDDVRGLRHELKHVHDDWTRPSRLALHAFAGAPVLMVACGEDHTIVLAQTGSVWTWGHGARFCLGHGDDTDKWVPTQLADEYFAGSLIATVAASAAYSVAVTVGGHVWTWGTSRWGCLGHSGVEVIPRAAQIDCCCFCCSPVVMVAAGSLHVAAVTQVQHRCVAVC